MNVYPATAPCVILVIFVIVVIALANCCRLVVRRRWIEVRGKGPEPQR